MPLFRPDPPKDAEHQRTIRNALARSLQILQSSAPPDTFLGRMTQEAFPLEDDPLERHDIQNLINSELKPPE
ncbi:hypothetical protein [Bradyrhizobium sp. ARR65]|uniref:hypothetical protein n=1 Tax=Bradyrhizobium sp. ARR65 TaxID=1040989 RepID=UPI0004635CAC|nr:hypothetical protein [Bradyrhizobium sp. ARR65]